MSEPFEPTAAAPSGDFALCPWCSAPVSAADTTCPACHVALPARDADQPIPGLTTVDPALKATEARLDASRPTRTGLLAMILGDGRKRVPAATPVVAQPVAPAETGRQALEPPSAEVRREMLRIELERELARARAEAAEQALEEAPPAVPEPSAEADRTEVAAGEQAGSDANGLPPTDAPEPADAPEARTSEPASEDYA
jgi:hypothetical protein